MEAKKKGWFDRINKARNILPQSDNWKAISRLRFQ
jgi:hypothetical protein